MRLIKGLSAALALTLFALSGQAQDQAPMTFFVASAGSGNGGNLGGLAGADAICQRLAASAGRGDATWHAYMSAAASGNMRQVNARDRIGAGPWHNAKGVLIAANVADLHEDRNSVRKDTALNENGEEVNGRGDQPNRHDMLTGSQPDGRAFPDGDHTCSNYTRSDDVDGVNVQLGHSDRSGGGNYSWNSAHGSAGCSQPALVRTGGAGLFYCFAVN